MICSNCGKEMPDGSIFCPECGFKQKDSENTEAPSASETAPVQANTPYEAAPVSAPNSASGAKKQASGDTGAALSVFFKEYFKNPIAAVSERAKDEYWLWGLISMAGYAAVVFLVGLSGIFGRSPSGMVRYFLFEGGYLIADIVRFATLVFAYFLFQGVFKLNKKSLPSVVAVTGLAFLPLLPVYIVGLVFDRILTYSSPLAGLNTAVYVFAGIILFDDLKKTSDDKEGTRSLLAIIISIACMPFAARIIEIIANHLY